MASDTPHSAASHGGGEAGATLLLIVLCLVWGITWPFMKIALNEVPPLSMRTTTNAIGALTLLAICLVQGRDLRLPNPRRWPHVLVASLLNIVGFSIFTSYAQIAAATSRVTILTYTLPVWTLIFAWAVLGERPSRIQSIAIALCAGGLAVLIAPLATAGIPLGLTLAVCTGLSWGAGTVYLKWARIEADPVSLAFWQVLIAFLIIGTAMFAVDGGFHFRNARADGWFGIAFTGILGNGLAYLMWFTVLRRLPAATASLGILAIPMVGVISTVVILGERPTAFDMIGFVLIMSASVCVLLAPHFAGTAKPGGPAAAKA
jgi:drug/metabolite transporter (DMT)-like permease